MTLATAGLASAKGKLDIPTADTSLDTFITECVNAAIAKIMAECGYDETAASHTEYLTRVEFDELITTKYRPVDATSAIVANVRYPGSTTKLPITTDLIDPAAGQIKLVPYFFDYGPERIHTRKFEHAIVELTYKTTSFAASTDGYEIPDAIASLAAYWFKEDRSLAKSVSVGQIHEQLLNMAIPDHILAKLARHKRRAVRWA